MKLTNRDKKLLVALMCILLIVGFVQFAIRPLAAHIEEQSNEITQLDLQKQDMEMKILQAPAMEKNLTDMTTEFQQQADGFYTYMRNQEVDRIVTSIVLANGLSAVSSSITMPSNPLTIEYYVNSTSAQTGTDASNQESGQDTSAEDAVAAESGSSTDTTASAPATNETTAFYAPQVQITVQGSHGQVQGFIDDISNNYPAIRISSYSMSQQQAGTDMDQYTLNAVLIVYTMDKSVL